jgi:hypothetical protein
VKKGRAAKKKVFYKEITKKKRGGGTPYLSICNYFLNPLPPYDIILRIISR